MNYVAFDVFHQDIRPNVPTAPTPTVDRSIRRAAVELCKQAECLRDWLAPLTLVPGRTHYELDVPDCLQIHNIHRARLTGGRQQELAPASLEALRQLDPAWNTSPGTPAHFFKGTGNTVHVGRVPNTLSVNAVEFHASLKPALNADKLPEGLAEDYYDTLINGALLYLFRMPGMSWHDSGEAKAAWGAFQQGIQDARSHSQGDQTAKPVLCSYGGL